MYLTILSFILAALGSPSLWAEEIVAQDTDKPSLKQELYEALDGPLMVQGIFEAPFSYLYLGQPDIKGVVYAPSFAPRLGARVLSNNLGATLTFALPIPHNEKYRRGTSQQTAVILNSYWRQNAIDAYYQQYRGFYVSSAGRELSTNKPTRYPQLPEATMLSFGFNWYHVFRPETYSLKAAFDFTEFQRVSGGSWILNPFYNHLEVSLGNVFVPGIGDESIQAIPNLASGRFNSLGSSIGYGYSYIWGRFFASGLAALGPGLQFQNVRRADGGDDKALNVAWKINVNASMGWNSHAQVGGLKVLFDSLSSRVVGREVASNLVSAQLFYGLRF